MFKGKKVLLGVCGGIAAYKACDLARSLLRDGIEVFAVMTESAAKLVQPLTFKALTGKEVGLDIFSGAEAISHIALARSADAMVIAPATANTIAKFAGGIADNLVTTIVLASKVPVIVAPAMNVAMWENPATRANIRTLESRGFIMVKPQKGEMACGEYGEGRLAEIESIADAVRLAVAGPKTLSGKKFVVTSGPTREPIDPVRYISNRSSGKMGAAVAFGLALCGADVAYVHGPSEAPPPGGVRPIAVETAVEMKSAVMKEWKGADGAVLVAAVADFRPSKVSPRKLKKAEGAPEILLEENPDILAGLGRVKGGRFLAGFAAETDNVIENARKKLESKNLDMIAANDVSVPGAGFGSDTNTVRLIFRDGRTELFENMSKREIGYGIAKAIAGFFDAGR